MLILILSFAVFLVVGVPIAYALGLSSLLYFLFEQPSLAVVVPRRIVVGAVVLGIATAAESAALGVLTGLLLGAMLMGFRAIGNLPECLRGDFGPGHRRDIPGRGTLPAGQFHNADADLRIPRSGTLGTGDLDGLRRHRMLRFVDDAAQPASPECHR